MSRAAISAALFLLSLLQSCANEDHSVQESPALSREFLISGSNFSNPVLLSEFERSASAAAPTNRFAGRLLLAPGAQAVQFEVLRDELGLVAQAGPEIAELPPFDFEFVQDGDRLIPLQQGPVASAHPWWEFVLQPGYTWNEARDNGLTRAVIPFALKERNADCIHNGLMGFLFDNSGEISSVAFQVSNQTCKYLQFRMFGLLAASYVRAEPASGAAAISAATQHRNSRMPQRRIVQLSVDFPGIDSSQFGSVAEINPADMSAFGFVIDGVHYVGGCDTPYGPYSYCDEMALPSYSTAKSLVGGLGLMLAEKQYPGIRNTLVADYVATCNVDWNGVTVEHALDLVTGHYGSPELHVDEDTASARFFAAEDHAGKIDFACNEFPRKAPPGEHWSYQTWATYLAGTTLNNRLKFLNGNNSDFYDDLIVDELWKPLQLSELMMTTRRTYDDVAQPFTGFGLTMVRDDVAKLVLFLGANDGMVNGEAPLDRNLFDAIKQRSPGDPGMQAESELIRYNNGFRTFDVGRLLGCSTSAWLTTMSGYGGINVVLMPNDSAYYYFSDGNVHRYLDAVRESHRIRPLC
jgi:hypothetical protein